LPVKYWIYVLALVSAVVPPEVMDVVYPNRLFKAAGCVVWPVPPFATATTPETLEATPEASTSTIDSVPETFFLK